MAGINKVIILGNLGADPEVRSSTIGKIVTLSVATSEQWNDKQSGERKERTEWHRVVIFNERLGEVAEKYLHKGSKVYLEGQNETRKYTNKDGIEVYTTEVVLRQYRGELQLVDSKASSEGGGGRDDRGGREDRGGYEDRGASARGRGESRDTRSESRDTRGRDEPPRRPATNGSGRDPYEDRGGRGRTGQPPPREDLDDEIPF